MQSNGCKLFAPFGAIRSRSVVIDVQAYIAETLFLSHLRQSQPPEESRSQIVIGGSGHTLTVCLSTCLLALRH